MATTQFVARNGLIALTDSTISGSLLVSQSVTATSFTGSFTGSFFGTASYASQSFSASYAETASYALSALTASYVNTLNQNVIITGSIQMSGSSYISGVDYIDFDVTAAAPAQSEGRLFWNIDSKTLQLDLEQNFHTDINQQMLVRVVNKTGADIPSGSVVYISGSQGQRPGIKLASYESDDTSAATVGFTVKTINNNNNGYIITRGILDGLDTSGYSVGDRLFLSSSGTFTNVAPDAPLHEVRLGKVIVSDAGTGSIYVDIMNGYELDELHDVKATNPNYGDLFMYSSSLWIATKELSGSYALTGSFFIIGQNANIVSQDSYKTNDFFLVKNSTTSLKLNSGVEVSASVAIPFSVAKYSGENLLSVSQSGMVIFATSSIDPTGIAPNGALWFTSGALFIGID